MILQNILCLVCREFEALLLPKTLNNSTRVLFFSGTGFHHLILADIKQMCDDYLIPKASSLSQHAAQSLMIPVLDPLCHSPNMSSARIRPSISSALFTVYCFASPEFIGFKYY